MSIRKTYSSVDTLRTFANNMDIFRQADTIFITPDDFTMAETDFLNVDYWYTQLGINIFPIHNINEFQSQDEETSYKQSLHGTTYKLYDGQYRHKLKYNFSIDYHQLINTLSGQTLNIIYASGSVLRAVKLGSGLIKGFYTSAFELEKMLFNLNGSNGNSDLFVELLDSDELNIYGYDAEVEWTPSDIDRLVLNISLVYSTDTITMSVKYLNENIIGLQSTDITITDDIHGALTFSTFIPGDGIYLMSGFKNISNVSVTPTYGCLYIQSTIYIGNVRYSFNAVVQVVNSFILLSNDNFTLLSGDNFIQLN